MRSSRRQARKARPGLEGLEGRQLLSSGVSGPGTIEADRQGVHRKNGVLLQDRRMSYTTPQGTHVVITLYGHGSLQGSTLDPDGALNLVFRGTNEATGIVGRVSGGTGRAPVRSIRNANLGLENYSGVGSTLLNVVNLKDFDLVDGGQVDLTGGVHTFFLRSAGRNTQIHLRELPAQFLNSSSGGTSATNNGVNTQFVLDLTGARTLTQVSGTPVVANFALLSNQPRSSTTSGHDPGPPPAPPGIVASIGQINGRPRVSSQLGNAQVFGYDPVANALIRFDTVTGAALQTIPLAGLGTMTTGVALGRAHDQLVALIGNGTTVFAFNALDGTPRGQFATTGLAADGFNAIDGIGSTDNRTVLLDSTAGPGGMAQSIDLTASLDSGQVVPVGGAFSPQREFGFSGGMSGLAGSNTIYATGAAFFDTFQPNLTQAGVLALNDTSGRLGESSRTALKSNGNFINAGPLGTAQSMPFQALGSIDQSLALVTGVDNGQNVVALLNPVTLANQGTVTLNDPNRLSGLSESFRPDLVDTALVDIQGNLQSFRSTRARGLVLNDLGFINLAKIQHASDTTIVALPFGHAEMPDRSNVTIISTARNKVGDRNGVTLVPNLRPVGPLSLPTPSQVRTT